MSKLSTITKALFDRSLATKRVSALTGGTRNVDTIVITDGGSGYLSAPTVGFTGGGGSGAAGTAVIANGIVVSVTITANGTGYTSTPGVTFTGGSGTGATATAIMAAETLDAIVTTTIATGEMIALVAIGGVAHLYQLTAGTTAESSPSVIRPDDYAGGTNEKVWLLQGLIGSGAGLTALNADNISSGTLAVGRGGTGTPTAFTAGSLVFAGASGVYSQANAQLFWDSANSRLGIGTASPSAKLTLGAGTAAAGTAPLKLTSGTLLTTAEAGAVEFLTDAFYATITTGAARKAVVLADATLTSGRVPFMTTNGRLADDSLFTWDNVNKRLGIGTASPIAPLSVSGTHTGTAYGFLSAQTYTPTADSSQAVYGGLCQSIKTGAFNLTSVGCIGFAVQATQNGTGTIAALQGVTSIIRSLDSGAITSGYSFYAQSPGVTAGSIAIAYGVFIQTQKASGVTTGYGIYSQGTADINFFGGVVSLGVASPTARLHIAAGAAAASSAPLKFTSGTNLTTAEAGAMEYNGTNLFFTRAGTTRENVVCASAVTTEAVASDTTLTVNINGTTYKILARA